MDTSAAREEKQPEGALAASTSADFFEKNQQKNTMARIPYRSTDYLVRSLPYIQANSSNRTEGSDIPLTKCSDYAIAVLSMAFMQVDLITTALENCQNALQCVQTLPLPSHTFKQSLKQVGTLTKRMLDMADDQAVPVEPSVEWCDQSRELPWKHDIANLGKLSRRTIYLLNSRRSAKRVKT